MYSGKVEKVLKYLLVFNVLQQTPNVDVILVQIRNTELYYAHFLQIFNIELVYVTFEMIHLANLKGRQF